MVKRVTRMATSRPCMHSLTLAQYIRDFGQLPKLSQNHVKRATHNAAFSYNAASPNNHKPKPPNTPAHTPKTAARTWRTTDRPKLLLQGSCTIRARMSKTSCSLELPKLVQAILVSAGVQASQAHQRNRVAAQPLANCAIASVRFQTTSAGHTDLLPSSPTKGFRDHGRVPMPRT